jgi:CelD/BcsL family acetyltransferase involved in cellulose biosynthesis
MLESTGIHASLGWSGGAALDERVADHVDVLSWHELDAMDRAAWQAIRCAVPEYRSPFFSLAFSDAIAAVRHDVLVAVLRCGREAIGFLPFHRLSRVAEPVGRFFNDAHNVIAWDGAAFDWLNLLRDCGVKAYNFHALCGPPSHWPDRYQHGTIESFSVEFAGDSASLLAQLEADHHTIRRQEQKSRKMARELGPLQLEIDCKDTALLSQTIDWKRQQYRRTNILDFFAPGWTRDLMHRLHQMPAGGSRGLLSVLRAGDEVVAAHYGMIEGGLLHYWFPTYNVRFAQYSPGTALFKEIVRAATAQGIECIDMGYGEQPYKRKQTDTVTTVAYGCVTTRRLYGQWRRCASATRVLVKRVPMKHTLKRWLRRLKPDAGISKVQ